MRINHVALTQLPNGTKVSTVNLPMPIGYLIGIYYETLAFDSNGNSLDETMRRYATREEAEAGHLEVVNQLLEEMKNG